MSFRAVGRIIFELWTETSYRFPPASSLYAKLMSQFQKSSNYSCKKGRKSLYNHFRHDVMVDVVLNQAKPISVLDTKIIRGRQLTSAFPKSFRNIYRNNKNKSGLFVTLAKGPVIRFLQFWLSSEHQDQLSFAKQPFPRRR